MSGAATCDRSDLCAELSGASDTDFRRTYPDAPPHRYLAASAHTAAIVDLSPMVLGHSLLVPRLHFLSVAETLLDTSVGFTQFLKDFTGQYEATFGDYVLMEHGSTKTMNQSACISHAHVHILPLDSTMVLQEMQSDGLVFREVGAWDDVADLAGTDLPYYLVANASRIFLCSGPQRMRSQYFRTIVGRILGIPSGECDYSVVVRRQLLVDTLDAWGSPGERLLAKSIRDGGTSARGRQGIG